MSKCARKYALLDYCRSPKHYYYRMVHHDGLGPVCSLCFHVIDPLNRHSLITEDNSQSTTSITRRPTH